MLAIYLTYPISNVSYIVLEVGQDQSIYKGSFKKIKQVKSIGHKTGIMTLRDRVYIILVLMAFGMTWALTRSKWCTIVWVLSRRVIPYKGIGSVIDLQIKTMPD